MFGHRRACRTRAAAWGTAVLLTATLTAAGCAAPYRGPRTVAATAVGLLAGSAALWVVGERTDRRTLANIGAAGTALGTLGAGAAGVWIAASAGCRVDPDCPEDEVCREIPAPPDREPYRQCSPR
ncbi:MAG TPA: hypothetical protein VGF45_24260 [Polyangia bacterium]